MWLTYIFKIANWVWTNKWTIIIGLAFVIILSMYGCEKRQNQNLENQIQTVQKENQILESAYKSNKLVLNLCESEIEMIQSQIQKTRELEFYIDKLSKDLPNVKEEIDSMEDSFELRKSILREIISGKHILKCRED